MKKVIGSSLFLTTSLLLVFSSLYTANAADALLAIGCDTMALVIIIGE